MNAVDCGYLKELHQLLSDALEYPALLSDIRCSLIALQKRHDITEFGSLDVVVDIYYGVGYLISLRDVVGFLHQVAVLRSRVYQLLEICSYKGVCNE